MRWSAGNIWATVFLAYIGVAVALRLIQQFRGKEIWQSRTFGLHQILHIGWALPIALPLMMIGWILKCLLTAPIVLALASVWLFHKTKRALSR